MNNEIGHAPQPKRVTSLEGRDTPLARHAVELNEIYEQVRDLTSLANSIEGRLVGSQPRPEPDSSSKESISQYSRDSALGVYEQEVRNIKDTLYSLQDTLRTLDSTI